MGGEEDYLNALWQNAWDRTHNNWRPSSTTEANTDYQRILRQMSPSVFAEDYKLDTAENSLLLLKKKNKDIFL